MVSFIIGFAMGTFFGIVVIAILDVSRDHTKGDKDE